VVSCTPTPCQTPPWSLVKAKGKKRKETHQAKASDIYPDPLEVHSEARLTGGVAMALSRMASLLERLACRGRISPPKVVRRPVFFITGSV
jgi:hypothetical protein